MIKTIRMHTPFNTALISYRRGNGLTGVIELRLSEMSEQDQTSWGYGLNLVNAYLSPGEAPSIIAIEPGQPVTVTPGDPEAVPPVEPVYAPGFCVVLTSKLGTEERTREIGVNEEARAFIAQMWAGIAPLTA